jgi:hypothetical protein
VLCLIDDVWNELIELLLISCCRSSISLIEFVWMILDGICWSRSLITIILRLLRSSIKESIAIQFHFLFFLQRTPILILLLHVQPRRILNPILMTISTCIRIPIIDPTGINILIIRPIRYIKWTSSLSLIESVIQRTRYQSLIKHKTF